MTDIENKALALLNEVREERGHPAVAPFYLGFSRNEDYATIEALCRAIEQHEAFRQEVSDAISELSSEYTSMGSYYADKLKRFIIAKPDPLAECLLEMELSENDEQARHDAEWLVKALAKRDGKIVWGEG